LSQRWQKAPKPAGRSATAKGEGPSPLELFEHLKTLVSGRFSGDEAVVVNRMLEELHLHLCRVFPKGSKTEPRAEDIAALHEALNRLEDLLDAYEIDRPTGKGR
jgi:hypothetical protein